MVPPRVLSACDNDRMCPRPREISDDIYALSDWIDTYPLNAQRSAEALVWGRVAKLTEETGEVAAALIGVTGQNPRKGVSHAWRDVEDELLDVALTAMCAVAHLHSTDAERPDVVDLFSRHLKAVTGRSMAGSGGPDGKAPQQSLPRAEKSED